MKRTISSILMASILLLMLAGCNQAPEESKSQAEPPQPSSTLHADHLSAVQEDQFDRVFQTVIDPEGEHVALYTDGLLKDFVVEQGTMDADAVTFHPDHPLFRARELDADTLLILYTYFTDTVPTLRVSYTGPDGPEQCYLFQSGKDGSILMIAEQDW